MFCCCRSQNRLRGVAVFGLLLSLGVGIITFMLSKGSLKYWGSEEHGKYFKSFQVADFASAFFLFCGSFFLLLRTLRVPPRIVTAVDIYNDMSETRQSNLRAYDNYGEEPDLIDFSSEFSKDCTEATYNRAVEKTGVDSVSATTSRFARLFLFLSAGSFFNSILTRAMYVVNHKTYTEETRVAYASELAAFAGIVVYFVSALIVLYVADPAKVPFFAPRSVESENTHFIAPDALSFLSDVPGVPSGNSNLGSTNRAGMNSRTGMNGSGSYNPPYGQGEYFDKPGSGHGNGQYNRSPRY